MSVAHQTNYPDWTEEQLSKVTHVVSQEAQKARVAAQFLPLYGPVHPSTVAVPRLLLGNSPNPAFAPLRAPNRLIVDSTPDVFLATLAVSIPLATHDVADPEMGAALVAFRRAAVTLARVEDALIFNGQPGPGQLPLPMLPGGWMIPPLPQVFTISAGASQAGLVPTGSMPGQQPPPNAVPPRISQQTAAANIVADISAAIGQLEAHGHSGGFACFLSQTLFDAAHIPAAGLVMPRDRIIPFLGGEYLRRTNTIPNDYGIIVALGGQPVEIVVASDISVKFLQVTPEPRFLFRISERIALRVKEWNAVAVLHP